MMDVSKLLIAIWGKKSGYIFLPFKTTKKWEENSFKYPDDIPEIEKFLNNLPKADTYWCPIVFKENRRLKEYAQRPNVLWADLDEVNPTTLGDLTPSIAWKSSDNKYQCLWIIDHDKEGYDLESINRALTYKTDADKSGWDFTQVLRIPGTMNYKYNPPQKGKILWVKNKKFKVSKLAEFLKEEEAEEIEDSIEELIDGYEIPERTRDLLFADDSEVVVGERSDRLWEIETSLLEAGVPVADVIKIVQLCPFNKFKGRRDEVKQIYTEVLKAEKHVKNTKITSITIKGLNDKKPQEIKQDVDIIQSFDEFVDENLAPPEWLVKNIWQLSTYGMIAGEPKTYKSVQSTDLCISIASGAHFLNHFETLKCGAVLYVQEENGKQTVQDRVRKISAAKGILSAGNGTMASIPLYFMNNLGLNLKTKESRELLDDAIAKIRPLIIVLDPLYMMFGDADENSATEVGDILKWLTGLRNKYECSILICHHYNKSANENTRGGKRIRGTGAFHAWVESALYIRTTQTKHKVRIEREFRAFPSNGFIDVEMEMGEPGDLTYAPKIALVDEVSGGAVMTLNKEVILDTLAVSEKTLNELQQLTGANSNELKKMLSELEEEGYIEKIQSGGGRGKKTKFRLVRSENDDEG